MTAKATSNRTKLLAIAICERVEACPHAIVRRVVTGLPRKEVIMDVQRKQELSPDTILISQFLGFMLHAYDMALVLVMATDNQQTLNSRRGA
jgi:hypothetical protein